MSELAVNPNVPPTPRLISIVIPVFNERDSLAVLHQEIMTSATANGLDVEVIFVDDGSRDGSWEVIREIASKDSRIRAIRFRTNFGKAAALSAGFKIVRGPICMTMDADLQDDPHEIPRFIKSIDGGLDVVSGWKKQRNDPIYKVLPSRVFNRLVGRLTGVKLHDHNCGMKCYRREVLQEVRLYGELHRFIPVLAAARGFRVGELIINHRRRKFGKSKYGFRRYMRGFLDLLTVKFITRFSQRPQHFLGSVGMFSFAMGMLGLFYLAITWVIRAVDPTSSFEPLHNRPLMIYSLGGVLLGAQLFSMGILAELLTAYQSRNEDGYSISEQIEPASTTPPLSK
ncbi:MAG: glycosyltransferase family 2 protein [Planctomycetes bacterium]|nr:glycosyltransferase family 2 protein [Planctomycetota bacterium]